MSLLTICQQVVAEIGLLTPSTIIGNPEETAIRLRAVAAAAGEHIYRAANWTTLQREHEFVTSAGVENYPVPEDFGRSTMSTAWDRTRYQISRAGLSPQQWARRRGGLSPSPGLSYGVRWLVGPLAGSALLDPVPASPQTLVYEYVSKYFIEDAVGEPKAAFTADSDEIRLEPELFRQEVLWRMKRAIGQAYADERADAELLLRNLVIADLALEPTQLGAPRFTLPEPQILEHSWPGP